MRCGERGSLNECRNTTIVAIMVWFSAQHLGMLPPNSHPTVVHCTEVETSSEIATCSLIAAPSARKLPSSCKKTCKTYFMHVNK